MLQSLSVRYYLHCSMGCTSVVLTMKMIAAYLLAVLGGNTSPTADDVKNILESGNSAMLFVTVVG